MTTATRELTSIKNDFAGLKSHRFTSSDIEAKVQEYIEQNDSFKIAHLKEIKVKVKGKFSKSKWAIVYDWNAEIKDDVFPKKEEAQSALDYYLDHMANSPAIKIRNVLLMDKIRAEVTHRLLNGYRNKVADVQARQGEILAKQAKQSVKSMLKGFRR